MNKANPYQPPETPATATRPDHSKETQFCYVSTPAHQRTLWGRFIWIYTGSGYIEIDGPNLIYTYRNGSAVTIDLATITDVSIGSFSRISKPIRLDYIAVQFASDSNHDASKLYFTPTNGAATPVWQTNRIVASWAGKIRDAIASVSSVAHEDVANGIGGDGLV